MSLCTHPIRHSNNAIYKEDCRKCKLHQTESGSLERCPFCGGKARLGHYFGKFHIECSKCSVEMKDYNIDVVMKKWNKRIKRK